ncbi:hypothetical protein ACKKBG_A39260 [Auxenochlorella protothecoides x Auxenochlorella symbiontica]
MGNSGSRHRPPLPTSTPPAAPSITTGPPPPPEAAVSAQYPPQSPYPYPPAGQAGAPPYANNGRTYGGWQPSPYLPPRNPLPAQHVPRHYGGPPAPAPPTPAPASQELTQTATIRNAVNLKKASLRVAPGPTPDTLSISFTFDASSPCVVSVFLGAREDVAHGCRLTAGRAPAAPAAYPRGLGHTYPPAGTPGTVIEAAQLPGLLAAPRDTHPLVIRLETVTEAGAAAGRSLEDLRPGEEQAAWVQSQTTYAALLREEDGSYAVRVSKQKIWVEGVSYELQEIYGLEQSGMVPRAAGAEARESAEDAEERLCVICLVNDRDTTVLPCRHMCMCHECAQELRKQTSKCPICRNHVESLLHIKMTKGARRAAAAAVAAAAAAAATSPPPPAPTAGVPVSTPPVAVAAVAH